MVENSFRYRCHDGWSPYRVNDVSAACITCPGHCRFLKLSLGKRPLSHIATLNLRRQERLKRSDVDATRRRAFFRGKCKGERDQGSGEHARATKEVNYCAYEFFMGCRKARHHRRQISRAALV